MNSRDQIIENSTERNFNETQEMHMQAEMNRNNNNYENNYENNGNRNLQNFFTKCSRNHSITRYLKKYFVKKKNKQITFSLCDMRKGTGNISLCPYYQIMDYLGVRSEFNNLSTGANSTKKNIFVISFLKMVTVKKPKKKSERA
ncbi:hypothetical protein M0811_08448 [Anaeramoeba ignava]|uniref:Uncharacterized protein n=1 Tax=Anaeramoeba ignava TaxID=1746090 RepID=A0A9Q0LHT7_ANAIG|nr:hypothetical protein M0811_08448 [Anaeramoeba ignava]